MLADVAEGGADVAHVLIEARRFLAPRDVARFRRDDDEAELFGEREQRALVVAPSGKAVQHDQQRHRRARLVRLRDVERAVADVVGQPEPRLPVRNLVLRVRGGASDASAAAAHKEDKNRRRMPIRYTSDAQIRMMKNAGTDASR